MAGNIKRMIKEEGVVLEKIFKGATSEFRDRDGRLVEAQPDRYFLKVVSGEDFNKENGFLQSTVLEYKVEKQVYDAVKAYTPVIVKYEVSNYGAKPMEVLLKNN